MQRVSTQKTQGKEQSSHEKLTEVLKLTKENNKMLHAMRRNALIGTLLKLTFLVIIIGLPVAVYYYILAPYVVELQNVYSGIQGEVENVKQFREGLSDLFNKLPR